MIYKSIPAFFVFLLGFAVHLYAQYPGTNSRQQEEINRRQVER